MFRLRHFFKPFCWGEGVTVHLRPGICRIGSFCMSLLTNTVKNNKIKSTKTFHSLLKKGTTLKICWKKANQNSDAMSTLGSVRCSFRTRFSRKKCQTCFQTCGNPNSNSYLPIVLKKISISINITLQWYFFLQKYCTEFFNDKLHKRWKTKKNTSYL